MKKRKLVFLIAAAILIQLTCAPCALAWRSALYPDDWQPGYADASGHLLQDFSYAGYMRGERPLPDTPGPMTVDATAAPYLADNTGAQDATRAIQRALDAVGSAGGGTVYLPAGTYLVRPQGEDDFALRIAYDGVLLKGAGVGQTFLYCDETHMRNKVIIRVGKNGWWDLPDDGTMRYFTRDVSDQPTQTIYLNDLDGLREGDYIVLRADWSDEWILERGMSRFWHPSTRMGTTFYRRITAIDRDQGSVEIDIPTRDALRMRDDARAYKLSPEVVNAGLSDFSIGNREYPSKPRGSGFSDYGYLNKGTPAYNVHNSYAIQFRNVVDCWAQNIESYRPAVNRYDVHTLSNGMDLTLARSVTVDHVTFSKPQYEGAGGNGYGFNVCAGDCLISNCTANGTRHSLSLKESWSTGNVIYGFRSSGPGYPLDFHMHFSAANLLDNTTLVKDFIEAGVRDAGDPGRRHGVTTTSSVIWNTMGEAYRSGKSYIVLSKQYGYGYVIGTSGPAFKVSTTPTTVSLGSLGKVGTSPADYVEGMGAGATLEPRSLYYDQLARRLAREAG